MTGTTIRIAASPSPFWPILVAVTRQGIRAIRFGRDRAALARELGRPVPGIAVAPAASTSRRLARRVAVSIRFPARRLPLPLDPCGTAFQRRVWTALRRIPAGTTLSYGELARRIGAHRSVRAVAGACAANGIAVAIPCHRVIAADGSLGGYRWGLARKRALLDREVRR